MKRIWHPYTKWEDYLNGMYSTKSGISRKRLVNKAIKFTGNHEHYGSFMAKVIESWPVSCEHNLTDVNSNRKAWIGHAAACMAIKCPEDITREAWGYLTQSQQDAANAQAEKYIKAWESRFETKDT